MEAISPVAARNEALEQLGQLVAGWAFATVPCEGASVTVIDGPEFAYVGAAGTATPYLRRRYPLDASFTGEVLATGRSRVFHADRAAGESRERASKYQVRHGIVVAASIGGRPLGTVGVITSSDDHAFDPAAVKKLEHLGRFWARGVAMLETQRWTRSPVLSGDEDPYVTAVRSRLERAIDAAAQSGNEGLSAELIGIGMLLDRLTRV